MSEVLDRAKEIERNTSSGTGLYIKLALLQDLIAEIEQLRAAHPLRVVRGKAEEREGAKP